MAHPLPCRLRDVGVSCALGRSTDEIWPRLLAGDQSGLRLRSDLVPGRSLLVGEVGGSLPRVPDALAHFACRNNALTMATLEPIGDAIRGAVRRFGQDRVGVVMGSTTSGVSDAELAIRHQLQTGSLAPSFHYEQLEFGGAAGFVAALLDLRGPTYTISTACSSGARALASARSLLRLGLCDAVIAGATDTLCGLTTNGFSALSVVADAVSNPCSANRQGLTLGEASALFLVTAEAGGIQLVGVGESSEAHHMSAPHPQGVGAEAAMASALLDAGLATEEVTYLNLHGTGTAQNDAMECLAVARVFGAAAPPSSSTKSLVGHTLGAAGALEAAFCWLTLEQAGPQRMELIPHAFDGVRDPELAAIPLVAKGLRAPLGAVMTNAFGFGGNNCSLVLQRAGA